MFVLTKNFANFASFWKVFKFGPIKRTEATMIEKG